MFYDLRISKHDDVVKRAKELSYSGFAFDHVIDNISELKAVINSFTESTNLLTQSLSPLPTSFSRITIIVEDVSKNYHLNSLNSANVDLIAVQPNNEKAWQSMVGNVDIDLISLDLSSRLPFHIKSSSVSLAISKGIYFEICYSKAIHDVNARKHFIANATSLIRATRGRNIIISSDAQNALYLRGPYDILNLFSLCGLNPNQAKVALTRNCKSLLIQAASRRHTARGALSVEATNIDDEIPRWKKARID